MSAVKMLLSLLISEFFRERDLRRGITEKCPVLISIHLIQL
jgi:hypothetical protein